MAMLIVFGIFVVAVIANVLGTAGQGLLGARQASWLLTLAFFGAMLGVAGKAVCARWDGIFIDRDNRISLSRFQLIVWTALILSAWFTAGLTNMTLGGSEPPLQITIPAEIWALLGLGGFTAVAAPAIKESQKRVAYRFPDTDKSGELGGPQAVAQEIRADQNIKGGHFVKRVFVKDSSGDARWIDLISGDYEGAAHVDVAKLQKLIITVVLAVSYGFAIWGLMKQGPFRSFPLVYPEFVALLGISHATYLADKQLGNT